MSDKPIRAGDGPIEVDLAQGQQVWWCACGRSQTQPFCDGSHKVCALTPIEFTAPRNRTYYFCVCKQSGKRPLCDGSHELAAPVLPPVQ